MAAQEEGGEGEDDGEETSTQRSRRKKRELAAFESRGAKLKAVPDEPPPEEEEGEEGGGGGAASGPPADSPCWPEVSRALEGSPKELLLERQAGQEGRTWQVDPALFRCTSLNLLKLSLKGADAAAPKPLRAVPDDLRFLTGQTPRVHCSGVLPLLTRLPLLSLPRRAAHPHFVQQRIGVAARRFRLAHGAPLCRWRHVSEFPRMLTALSSLLRNRA